MPNKHRVCSGKSFGQTGTARGVQMTTPEKGKSEKSKGEERSSSGLLSQLEAR